MTTWYEEEWAQKKLQKLEEARLSSNHRKIVRIVDKLMDKYDLDEPEVWDQLRPSGEGEGDESVSREN